MERRILLENIDQQLPGYQGIQRNPCPLVLRQLIVQLDYDQRPCLYSSHLKGSLYHIGNRLFRKAVADISRKIHGQQRIEKFISSQLLQRLPQLRLKQNNDRDKTSGKQAIAQPENRVHLENGRQHQECNDYHNSAEQNPRSRIFDPDQHLVNKKGDDDNFHHVRQLYGRYIESEIILQKGVHRILYAIHLLTSLLSHSLPFRFFCASRYFLDLLRFQRKRRLRSFSSRGSLVMVLISFSSSAM